MSSHIELKEAIATFEKVLARYTLAREEIILRRCGHATVELDDRLDENGRAIATIRRAVEITQEHLRS